MKVSIVDKRPAPFGGYIVTGWSGEYSFQAKVYDRVSEYGIDGGRVSKLWVMHSASGKVAATYDRGWDIEPSCKSDKAVTDLIIKAIN